MTLKAWLEINWLKAKNTFLNVDKIELVLFNSPKKQPGEDLKVKLNGEKHYETELVKYSGSQIEIGLETIG